MSYTITQKHISEIPQEPYRNGVGKPEGFVFHCTDNSNHTGGDTPNGESQYESTTWNSAFVHYFVGVENGQAVIIETADPNYLAWGCGHEGNQRFIQAELCMYDDPKSFATAYTAWVWLAATMLRKYSLAPSPAPSGTCWAHADVTKYLGNTDHTDPIEYLADHGISWQDHLANVQKVYDSLSPAPVVTPAAPIKEVPTVNQTDAEKFAAIMGDIWNLLQSGQTSVQVIGTMQTLLGRVASQSEAHRLANVARQAGGLPTT